MRLFLTFCVATATMGQALPAVAQNPVVGQTRTLDDLKREYRTQCGKSGSRERLLVAFDRAIRITTDPARRESLRRERQGVVNPAKPICPEPAPIAPSDTPQPPEPATAATPSNICNHPAPNANAAECRRWAPLLGRWTSPKYGGMVETTLGADGTITGTIIVASKTMSENGYEGGMTVLRGYRPAVSGGTWLFVAHPGEVFSAKQRDRKSGEPFGDAVWSNKGGVLHIAKEHPNRLSLTAMLESRLANYDVFVRVAQ